MTNSKNTLTWFTAWWLAGFAGCGDDGSSSGGTALASSSSTTDPSGTSSSTTGTTSDGSAASSTTSMPTTTTSSGSTATTGTGTDTGGSSGLCPEGPFESSPLPAPDLSADPISGTSSMAQATGLAEGPVWIDDALYFSQFSFGETPPSTIHRFTPGQGLETFIASAGCNGLAVDADGSIVAATHDIGGISRYALDTTRTTVIDAYEGTRFNSPNDLALDAAGNIYFTDPDYQGPVPAPQPVTGVYRVDPAGTATLIDGSLTNPNGIALSPDGTALYVGHPDGLVRYAVNQDGSVVAQGEAFAEGTGVVDVDGMTMDCAGNLYATSFTGGDVTVISPDGVEVGTIDVADRLTNVAFGGPNMTTLYATAGDPNLGDALYSVELLIPGYPY